MNYKKQLLAYSIMFPLMGAGLLSANSAIAYGGGMFGADITQTAETIATRQQKLFENEANMLGISVDEIKNAWAQGKSIKDLALENGITAEQLKQKIQANRMTQLKSELQALVSKGVITQAQADQRIAFVTTHQAHGGAKGKGHRHFMDSMM